MPIAGTLPQALPRPVRPLPGTIGWSAGAATSVALSIGWRCARPAYVGLARDVTRRVRITALDGDRALDLESARQLCNRFGAKRSEAEREALDCLRRYEERSEQRSERGGMTQEAVELMNARLRSELEKAVRATDRPSAARSLAALVQRQERAVLSAANEATLSRLTNPMSKYPRVRACAQALRLLAQAILDAQDQGQAMQVYRVLNWSNLANGFSKLPEDERCRLAFACIIKEAARRMATARGRDEFNTIILSNLANACSKFEKNEACAALMTSIQEVTQPVPYSRATASLLACGRYDEAQMATDHQALASTASTPSNPPNPPQHPSRRQQPKQVHPRPPHHQRRCRRHQP